MLAKRQIPNLLTFARVLAVPVSFVVMLTLPPLHPALFWLFLVSTITDFFDGYLARRWNAVTPLGTLLDPIADKLLVALMLIYLLMEGSVAPYASLAPSASSSLWETTQAQLAPPMFFLFIPVVIIILREIYISGLREFLAARQIVLPVSRGGKLKTSLQMLSILLLLAPPITGDFSTVTAGMLLLWLAAALTFFSAVQYTRHSWKSLR